MPLYEYECTQCGERTEMLQRFDDEPLSVCPVCGGPVRKLVSAPAVQFKGSGWYVTDYARSKSPAAGKSAEGGSTSEPAAPQAEKTASESSSAAKESGGKAKD